MTVQAVTPRQVAAAKALVNLAKRTGKPVEPEIEELAADAEVGFTLQFTADAQVVGRHENGIDINAEHSETQATAGP